MKCATTGISVTALQERAAILHKMIDSLEATISPPFMQNEHDIYRIHAFPEYLDKTIVIAMPRYPKCIPMNVKDPIDRLRSNSRVLLPTLHTLLPEKFISLQRMIAVCVHLTSSPSQKWIECGLHIVDNPYLLNFFCFLYSFSGFFVLKKWCAPTCRL